MANPSASLYVGDLAPDVDEGMLFTIFISVGPVASVRVCRDNLTRRSLGYAYVNFLSVVDAERALDTLNNTPISGKPCRIMWSQRDPTIRKSGVGNLYIKQLDPNITHKELFDTFSAFGNILSVKVAMDATGQSKGFGFVHFENAESADNAIKTVNDKILGTKRVYVGKFVTKKDRLKQKEQVWTNVFVKDIDPAVSDKDLEAKFAAFGPVTSCVIASSENTNPNGETTPSKFGFVNFENHEDAVKAVQSLHGADLGTKKIWCGRAQKKAEREQELKKKFAKLRLERLTKFQGINLYIKNLEEDITEDRLQNEFATYGAIRSCKIMYDENGINKGFGFVCFTTPEEAQRAINEMNNRPLSGFNKPLYVALHEPAELRKQKLAQRHAARTKGVRGEAAPLYYTNGNVPSGYVYRAQPRGVWQYAQPNYPVPHPNSSRGGGSRAGGRGGNNRNRNQRHHPAQVSPLPPPQEIGMSGLQPPQPIPELTLQVLSAYPFETQKLLLGERLYPLIHTIQPHLAGKITGMLLDSGWGADELLSLINDDAKLKTKVEEAINVLRSSSQPAEVHSQLAPPPAVEQEVAN